MSYQDIIYTMEEGIATITLNRPERLNALSPRLITETWQALQGVGQDDKVKVLVITGAGRGFCSGADLSPDVERPEPPRSFRVEPLGGLGKVMQCLYELAKPTIAAVNGVAAGAGISFALGCDIRIASENARFSSIFVRRALVPDCGATYFLPRIVGTSKALELMFTGDIIDAREAERIGLVSRVVPHDDLMKATRELALRIAKGPSVAIELTKRIVYKGLETNDFLSQLAWEAWGQSICHDTEDAKEGRQSFLEKREARFQGK